MAAAPGTQCSPQNGHPVIACDLTTNVYSMLAVNERVYLARHSPEVKLAGEVLEVPAGGGSVRSVIDGIDKPMDLTNGYCEGFAVDAGHVYFTSERRNIARVPLAGGARETLATLADGEEASSCIALSDSEVFLTTDKNLYKVSKSGGSLTQLAAEGGVALVVTADRVVWNGQSANWVLTVPIDGGSQVELLSFLAHRLAGAGQHVVYAEQSSPPAKVGVLSLEHLKPSNTFQVDAESAVRSLAADPNQFYVGTWSSAKGGAVDKQPYPHPPTPAGVVSGLGALELIAVDDSHVYWLDHGGGSIEEGSLQKLPR